MDPHQGDIRIVVGDSNICRIGYLTDHCRSDESQPSNHRPKCALALRIKGRQSALVGRHEVNHGEKGFVLGQLAPQGKVWWQREITVIDIPIVTARQTDNPFWRYCPLRIRPAATVLETL